MKASVDKTLVARYSQTAYVEPNTIEARESFNGGLIGTILDSHAQG